MKGFFPDAGKYKKCGRCGNSFFAKPKNKRYCSNCTNYRKRGRKFTNYNRDPFELYKNQMTWKVRRCQQCQCLLERKYYSEDPSDSTVPHGEPSPVCDFCRKENKAKKKK